MTQLKDVSLTSDREYLKIFSIGDTTISASGAPDSDSTYPNDPDAPFTLAGSTTITHNLGTIPLVRAFCDPNKNGRWYNGKQAFTDPWLKVIVTTSTVKLIMNTDGGAKTNIPVHYRIYSIGTNASDSDSLMDRIFLKGSSSVSANPSGGSGSFTDTTLTIPHNAGEAPLFTIQFSEDQISWYPEGAQIVGPFDTGSGPPGNPSRYYFTTCYASTDSTNLYLTATSNYGSARTVYFRYVLDYK